MGNYKHIKVPIKGNKITVKDGKIKVSNNPIIAFIEGDGIGPDIWRAAKHVLEAGVEKSFNGRKKISWMEIYAGDKAVKVYGKKVRERSVSDVIHEMKEAIKNPFVLYMNFQDDCFFTHNSNWIKEFCKEYKKHIKLPFIVTGSPGIYPFILYYRLKWR